MDAMLTHSIQLATFNIHATRQISLFVSYFYGDRVTNKIVRPSIHLNYI